MYKILLKTEIYYQRTIPNVIINKSNLYIILSKHRFRRVLFFSSIDIDIE